MITGLTGENLPQWTDTARTAGLPGIASFAKGLEQGLAEHSRWARPETGAGWQPGSGRPGRAVGRTGSAAVA
jgi:hypothetical protein